MWSDTDADKLDWKTVKFSDGGELGEMFSQRLLAEVALEAFKIFLWRNRFLKSWNPLETRVQSNHAEENLFSEDFVTATDWKWWILDSIVWNGKVSRRVLITPAFCREPSESSVESSTFMGYVEMRNDKRTDDVFAEILKSFLLPSTTARAGIALLNSAFTSSFHVSRFMSSRTILWHNFPSH